MGKAGCARRYIVRGRVQGVGYRYFVEGLARDLGLSGYARNLEDGGVEVYAVGTNEALSELSGYLWKGPRMSEVRAVHYASGQPGIHEVRIFEARTRQFKELQITAREVAAGQIRSQ